MVCPHGWGGVRVSPHSLGTLIEWKLKPFICQYLLHPCPHSLGTLIEWKPYSELQVTQVRTDLSST